MKTLITILLVVLFMFQSEAQDSIQYIFDEIGAEIANELQSSEEELPELNQKILHYVDSVEGMHIGKGKCRHFVNEAIMYAIKEKFQKRRKLELSRIFAWEGFNLPRKYALPGDIISLYNHVGIVYEVYKDKCYIKIAHQNGNDGDPVTIEDYYPLLRFQPKYIRIRWPYPPESEPPCH